MGSLIDVLKVVHKIFCKNNFKAELQVRLNEK